MWEKHAEQVLTYAKELLREEKGDEGSYPICDIARHRDQRV